MPSDALREAAKRIEEAFECCKSCGLQAALVELQRIKDYYCDGISYLQRERARGGQHEDELKELDPRRITHMTYIHCPKCAVIVRISESGLENHVCQEGVPVKASEELAKIAISLMDSDLKYVAIVECADHALLAAERAVGERQRKRDSDWLIERSRAMQKSAAAALAVNLCGMKLLDVPLEGDDAD